MRYATRTIMIIAAAAGSAFGQNHPHPTSCGLDCIEGVPEPLSTVRPMDRIAATTAGLDRGVGTLEDGSLIDILVVYTPAAAAAMGGTAGIEQLIDDGMAELNLAMTNSLVSTQYRLVGAEEVAYGEPGSLGTALNQLRRPDDGFLDHVHQRRDEVMADLVMLMTATGDVCGIANLGVGPGNTPTQKNAFSVVQVGCATANVHAFAHEIGHNMGLHHDWAASPCTNGSSRFAKGYVAPGDAYETVMGTLSPAPRVLYFSNPAVTYDGVPTGIAIGNPEPSDNATALMLSAPVVAKYRNRDCNANGVLDTDEITAGDLQDCNTNGIADLCEQDFNRNGIPDDCDIAQATSQDTDLDGVPDESEVPVLYVDHSAIGTGTGDSWANAMTDLQDALAVARASGDIDEIWLTSGTYKPASTSYRAQGFDLVSGVALRGGFDGSETIPEERSDSTPPTILSGDLLGDDAADQGNRDDNTINVLFIYDQPDRILLDRLVIERGNANLEVNCGGFMHIGGGVVAYRSDIEIADCEFRENAALQGGAASIVTNTKTRIHDSWFHHNDAITGVVWTANGPAEWRGSVGAVYLNGSLFDDDNQFISNRVEYNSSQEGASGVFAIGGRPIIANSVFNNNRSLGDYAGSALRVQLADGTQITNCTFADNNAPNAFAGIRSSGLFLFRTTATISNSILWNNTVAGISDEGDQFDWAGSGVAYTLDHSIVQGWSGAFDGTGSIGGDPLFSDAPSGDYTLAAGSAAIDMGNSAALPADEIDFDGDSDLLESLPFDLAGMMRQVDDPNTVDSGAGSTPVVDAGAFEFQPEDACLADFNGDDQIDFFDVAAFLGAFSAGDPAADFVDDDVLDFFDVLSFLEIFSAGCP